MPVFKVKPISFPHVFWACLLIFAILHSTARYIYASELTDFATISIAASDGQQYNEMQLLDGRYTTKLNISGYAEIKVEAQEKIHAIYIIWDKPPGYWCLQAKEDARTSLYLYGKSDYIHEYVELKVPSETLSVITSRSGAEICEIRIFSQGTLPGEVQVWNEPYEDADMLLLSTHADDEHLFFGGTMPYYAGELHYKVQIAYLTNHWAEAYRTHELLNGLWKVGMTAYPIISDFPDYYSDNLEHAKGLYNMDDVFAYEVGLLRRFKPEVVIGHDINGEYGHGVHMLNTWVLQQAIHLASDETYLPEQASEYGIFNVSKVYLHLYPENSVIMDWTIPLERFEGKTAFQMAEAGFEQHISQQEWFSVRNAGVHDCRAFGLYYTTVGYDSGTGTPDFFENVNIFSDDPAQEDTESSAGAVDTVDDGSVIEPDSENGFFENEEIKFAILLSCGLIAIFILFIIWGKKRDRI